MRRHLRYTSLDRALYPLNEADGAEFNPVDVPILDMLAVEAEKEYGWKYPSEETIRTYQDYRGLSASMLKHCKTEEIILNGNQTEKEQKMIISWYHNRIAEDNATMPNMLLPPIPRCRAGQVHIEGHAPPGRAGPVQQELGGAQ